MIALITGASSGLGRDFARKLAHDNIDLVIVGRREERLLALKNEIEHEYCYVKIIVCDLTSEENCKKLHNDVKDLNIDILINNAGYGDFGNFNETDLDNEIAMIKLNDIAIHILMKLFYQDFRRRNNGYILNVASAASFAPSPYMATYYATKSYVYRLTLGIYEENRRAKSKVVISVLCPGPVQTEFSQTANVKFAFRPFSSTDVVNYALKRLFKKKLVITPGILYKCLHLFSGFVPEKLTLRFLAHSAQKRGKTAAEGIDNKVN